ncbi:SDR family oxidoreductase [Bradyrhizobium diazoefficiens]|nr:SDR family oxidoreductase [Bradyrhizobium diazoefficiens]QQO21420.1 SDR family oxidoreductase [Bradyrhizobium diazoefficiens]
MILVTGAAGLNGSAVIREFSRNGVPVRALVRGRSKAGALAELPYVELVEGDMARPETLDRVLDGIDRALMISSSNPQMLETQCRFIDTCKAAGVAHVVKFSGKESGIGFDAKNFRFTRMHEEIERYLEGSGLGWTHLRPSQFMQVYLREAPVVAGKGLLLLPLDGVRLSPVDVEDIAKIAFALLTQGGHQGRALDITGPQSLSMAEIAAALSEAIGKPVKYQSISPEERRRGMQAAGLPPFMIDALHEQALERLRHPQSSVELGAHELFGVEPTSFVDFARRHAAVFGNNIN